MFVRNLGIGFGFLTFESEEAVDRCCSEHYVSINGKQVYSIINTQTTQQKPYVSPSLYPPPYLYINLISCPI